MFCCGRRYYVLYCCCRCHFVVAAAVDIVVLLLLLFLLLLLWLSLHVATFFVVGGGRVGVDVGVGAVIMSASLLLLLVMVMVMSPLLSKLCHSSCKPQLLALLLLCCICDCCWSREQSSKTKNVRLLSAFWLHCCHAMLQLLVLFGCHGLSSLVVGGGGVLLLSFCFCCCRLKQQHKHLATLPIPTWRDSRSEPPQDSALSFCVVEPTRTK